MNELFAHKADVFVPVHGTVANADVYFKDKVDPVISELKAENRRLKRALWIARAISAINAAGEIHNVIVCMRERHPKMSLSNTEAQEQVWKNVARKCRAKAEECK